ncbi:MAG: hypothetical protein M3P33_01930 [bacterium]|nr:hypothetical protein [bacterium]
MQEKAIKFIPDLLVGTSDYLIGRAVTRSRKLNIVRGFEPSAHMSFALTIWRRDANISLKVVYSSGAYDIWSIMRYWINIYDDIIDASREKFPTIRDLKHRHIDGKYQSNEVTSSLVQRIGKLVPDRSIRNDIYKILGGFRRFQYEVNHTILLGIIAGDVDAIEGRKLESSGDVMGMMVKVVNKMVRMDPDLSKHIEDGNVNYSRAGQWIDDLGDFSGDNGDPANLIVNASKRYDDEFGVLRRNKFKQSALKSAPKTMRYVDEQIIKEINRIPDDLVHTRRSLEFFYKFIKFYSAFETRKHIIK